MVPLLILASCGGDSPAPPAAAPKAPAAPTARVRGVLLVSIDTLRQDRLGLYGYGRSTSLNLDGLARRATVFDGARAQASQTAPSHASVFTSTFAGEHGIYNVHAEDAQWPTLPPGVTTLAEDLQGAGVLTAAFVSGGNLTKKMEMNRGFDVWDERMEDVSGRVDALLHWLRGVGDRPFFALLHTYQVHAPYVPPKDRADAFTDPAYQGPLRATYERYLAMPMAEAFALGVGEDYWGKEMIDYTDADVKFLSDLYDGEIAYVDGELRRAYEAVVKGPRAADTAIIVFGDHGEEFRDHGKFQHDQVFDELVHVPLLIDAGGALERQGWKGRVARAVQLVDLAPTIAELLGVAAPTDRWEGHSLVPLLQPETRADAEGRDAPPVFSELTREHGTQDYHAITWHGWKYILHRQPSIGKAWEHLFHLEMDPGEKINLIDSTDAAPTQALAGLRAQLQAFTERNAAVRSHLGESAGAEMSPEDKQALKSLGYVGGH
ncbi:MAG TPA: sulfatase-like hydrolase/transferase [Planctomycetota bacterium]|nr:sulfatase-like hydrolase/transferase [Planctomycetota bacterium]